MSIRTRLNTSIIWLLFIYIASVSLRIYYSSWIENPYYYKDEIVYSGMARSFMESGTFMYAGSISRSIPPLYPMLISIAYIPPDIFTTYTLIKIINSLVSASVIFPVWLLAKEFLSEKEAVIPATMAAVLPALVYSGMIMTENLHFPLTVMTVYLIYKSLTEENKKIDFLCGIFLGLSYLTKIFGVFMPIIFAIGLIFKPQGTLRERASESFKLFISKKWVFAIALLTVLPWIIRQGLLFGFTYQGIFGDYTSIPNQVIQTATFQTSISLRRILFFALNHLSYLTIASGVAFFSGSVLLLSLLSENRLVHNNFEKLRMFLIIIWSSIIIYVFYTTYHGIGRATWLIYGYYRVQGRYIDAILPLVILAGYIGLKYINDNYDKNMIKTFAVTIVFTSAVLIFAPFSFLSGQAVVVAPDILFLFIFMDFTNELFSAVFFVVFPFLFIILYRYNKLNLRYISLVFIIFLLFSGYFAFMQHVTSARGSGSLADAGKWLVKNTTKEDVVLIEGMDIRNMERNLLEWQTQFWLRDRGIRINVFKYQKFDFGVKANENFTLITNKSNTNYTWAYENITAGTTGNENYTQGITHDYISGSGYNQLNIRIPNAEYSGTLFIRSNNTDKGPMNLSINDNKILENKTIPKGHTIEKDLKLNVTDNMLTINLDGEWIINGIVLEYLSLEEYKGDYLVTETNLNYPKVFDNSPYYIYKLK